MRKRPLKNLFFDQNESIKRTLSSGQDSYPLRCNNTFSQRKDLGELNPKDLEWFEDLPMAASDRVWKKVEEEVLHRRNMATLEEDLFEYFQDLNKSIEGEIRSEKKKLEQENNSLTKNIYSTAINCKVNYLNLFFTF